MKASSGMPALASKSRSGGRVEVALLALELGEELIADELALFVPGAASASSLVSWAKVMAGLTTTGCMAVRSCRAS